MTFFEKCNIDGQRNVGRQLGLTHAKVQRAYHGATSINDELLAACASAWPDFDRPATVLEWDRRRAAWLERQRQQTHKQPAVGESEAAS